jgi:hypothetical protein
MPCFARIGRAPEARAASGEYASLGASSQGRRKPARAGENTLDRGDDVIGMRQISGLHAARDVSHFRRR